MIKKRLDLGITLTPGGLGQFQLIVNGETIATRGGNWLTRRLGAGYPDLGSLVDRIERSGAGDPSHD